MSDANVVDPEILAMAKRVIELEDGLRTKEMLWTIGLMVTEVIISDYDEMIGICEELVPRAPKDPSALKRLIRQYKIKRHEYRTRLKEEQNENV